MGDRLPMMNKRKQSGISIVELAIAIALMAFIAVVGFTFFDNQLKSVKHVATNSERFELMVSLKNRIDCSSIAPVCTPGELLQANDRNGNLLLQTNENENKFGRWNIRIQCLTDNNFRIQIAKKKTASTFHKDLLTKKDLDWDHPKSEIFTRKNLCQVLTLKKSIDNIRVIQGEFCLVINKSDLPCNPEVPPACDVGWESTHLTVDTFGGNQNGYSAYGQSYMRYCRKIR